MSPRRVQLAGWLTSGENPYFAKSYVNRMWGYLFGVGIIEPIDDIRAGNPPSNPELLDYLTEQFIESEFDVQALMKLIAKSRTYQLSVATNKWNVDDKHNYSHATARRNRLSSSSRRTAAVVRRPMNCPFSKKNGFTLLNPNAAQSRELLPKAG